jgi:25S rRNA (uracil2634-N3)-methyltransferase
MSKSKTKQRRREAKRDHQKKASKAAVKPKPFPTSKPSAPKRQNASLKKHDAPKENENKPQIQASQKHDIPFGLYDRILLVGEGDFSFTHSLCMHHGCATVTATSYDAEAEVREKYPTFSQISTDLAELTPPVPIHHSIDATKLSTYRQLRAEADDGDGEGWDVVAFMFPHTGGLSTDVNRQVRANQALLVEFFKSCLETTDAQKKAKKAREKRDNKSKSSSEKPPFLKMGGRVIVTIFEGEPYTLWNVRDLARHVGLKVVESFKFDWEQYPGYSHVRTLGAIEGGGAWKGEDRAARMYVFEKIPLEPDSEEEREMAKKKGKKGTPQKQNGPRRAGQEESESDEDD